MKKQIFIKSLTLLNFKGIRNLTITDFEKITNIYGENGTGKTTLFDSILWLWFGKDSTGRSDFEIKTLDKNNNVIEKIEHEVSAVISVGDVDLNLRKVLVEDWRKKRGTEVAEFVGNTTSYYWDDVPKSKTEYDKLISEIVEEIVFKLITDPMAFNANTPKWGWKERRNVLLQIAGSLSNEELAGTNKAYQELVAQLTNGKTLDDYKKQVANSILKAKQDIKLIPSRIDEVERGKPEVLDFEDLREKLSTKETELSEIDAQLTDSSRAFDAKLQEINSKKTSANTIKYAIIEIEVNARTAAKNKLKPDTTQIDGLKTKLSNKEGDLKSEQNNLETLKSKKTTLQSNLDSLDTQIKGKRSDWETENAKELKFDDVSFCCPTCQRDFDPSDIEAKKAEMVTNFKAAKAAKLKEISTQGVNLTNEKNRLLTEVLSIEERIDTSENTIKNLQSDIDGYARDIAAIDIVPAVALDAEAIYNQILADNPEYAKKQSELETALSLIEEVPVVNNDELKEKRATIIGEIDGIKSKLQTEQQLIAAHRRIAELNTEEATLAQQIANVEKTQFLIDSFEKHSMDTIEGLVKAKFKYVSFKLFNKQINGGLEPCCDTLINGVPFSDANTASRINAGLDIINTLCDFYQVTAPIFIDNRESVIELIPTESQIINLFVTEGAELSVGKPKWTKAHINKHAELV